MKWKYLLYAVVVALACGGPGYAQELSNVSLVMMPIQSAFVKGNVAKFRAINWTKDGAQSGIKSATLDAKVGKDVRLSFEGSGMVGDNDYNGAVQITKGDFGYIKLDYKTFRKYYENTGGYFPFTTTAFQITKPERTLNLDIANFAFEIGKGTPENPDLSFTYERDTKVGTKERLSWDYVKDTAFGTGTSQQRKLAPNFAFLNQTTDTLALKGKTQLAGFTVKGEGEYVFFDGDMRRQDQLMSNSSTASDKKITVQTENPQTKEVSTTVRAERWSTNDKTFVAFGYRFGHLRNNMFETEREYTVSGNFSMSGYLSGGRFRNGYAQSLEDTHTWTGQVLSNLTDKLAFISRFKAEAKSVNATSDYYTMTTADALTNLNKQDSENKAISTGESFSLRYSGLPKTSLYTDLELKQDRTWQMLDYRIASPGTQTYQESVNRAPEGVGTIGARFSPTKTVSVTSEYKHSRKDDKSSKVQVSNANTSYINLLRADKDEINTRLSWKPLKWLENSFKIKNVESVNHVQAYSEEETKMPGSQRDFIYDIALTPNDQWMFNFSFTRELLKIGARGSQYSYIPPPSTANVDSYMLTTSYAPTEKFSIFNSFEYARAKNKTNADGGANLTNVTSNGAALLYGMNEEWYNVDTGVRWSAKKNVTLEPHYAYYSFRTFPGAETGNYNAHILWLDVDVKW